MNLKPVQDRDRGPEVRLLCCACETWHPAANLLADLDGTPFVAYYCTPCSHKTPFQILSHP